MKTTPENILKAALIARQAIEELIEMTAEATAGAAKDEEYTEAGQRDFDALNFGARMAQKSFNTSSLIISDMEDALEIEGVDFDMDDIELIPFSQPEPERLEFKKFFKRQIVYYGNEKLLFHFQDSHDRCYCSKYNPSHFHTNPSYFHINNLSFIPKGAKNQ